MKSFTYHQTTKIIFGSGKINELPAIASQYGSKALLVTTPGNVPELKTQYARVKDLLAKNKIEVFHFDGVVPNPTIKSISAGARLAREQKVDMVIGLGGGSSMDSAKAISVEATHPGSAWDYLFYKNQPDPTKLLPIIAVSTTSGTGSQVTQVAVLTNPDVRDKSALYNNILYPQVSIIDPELMLTVPKFVTACTGFDVFCHAFESAIHPACSAYVELLAWEAIELVVEFLPRVLENLEDLAARERLAWADTLAGLCIANAGVTLPHGIGMAIGGMYPHVAHGEALAMVYPAFMDLTWEHAIPEFARLGRVINSDLYDSDDQTAASQSTKELLAFLKKIKLNLKLSGARIPKEELPDLAKQAMVLPDYQNNPKVATISEIENLLNQSF